MSHKATKSFKQFVVNMKGGIKSSPYYSVEPNCFPAGAYAIEETGNYFNYTEEIIR
jgi:hypothetical protein